MSEPRTAAGDALLTDLIQDHEAPSYHVIERVRRGILSIEAEARTLAALAGPAVVGVAHLERQREWSARTFGPGLRTRGVIDHIKKELREIEAEPTSLEWVDVVILALDGAWRAGHEPQAIIDAIVAKQAKNERRAWPDWRTASPDVAIEHDRSAEPEQNDEYRDRHEAAFRDHILGGPEDHVCTDLCSDAILDRLAGLVPRSNEYPPPAGQPEYLTDIAEARRAELASQRRNAGLDVKRLRAQLVAERAAAADKTALMNPERDYWIGVKDGYWRAIEAMDAAEPKKAGFR